MATKASWRTIPPRTGSENLPCHQTSGASWGRGFRMSLQSTARSADMSQYSSISDALVIKALTYMRMNLQSDMKIADIARHIGMSSAHFWRQFGKMTGSSPLAVLIQLRLEKAQHLLTSTDRPIKSIARDLGYRNVSSFGRAFLRFCGIAPAHYRRMRSQTASESCFVASE
jgi:transcriptional regulator GlxA family with amidase domain